MKTHAERLQELFFFARDVLGYDQLTELHLSWFDVLLKEKFVLLLAPVGHFKTSTATISYPLFRLTEDPNTRILLVNEILENSKGFLREIKGHLMQNPRFKEKYGNWDLQANAWTEERIQIPRSEIRKEPSIAVASVLGTVVSQHPNLIVVDDPCSNRNTQTPGQRLRVLNWFLRDLLPRLDDGGQIIVCMTTWHFEDLATHIRNDPGFAHWKILSFPAEWVDQDNQHHILFPEKFTKEKLAQIKAQLGTAAYNALYLNDPSGVSGGDFKLSWIEGGRYQKLPDNLTIYCGFDLAIGRAQHNARFAWSVIGVDKTGDVYVIETFRDRIPFNEQLKAIKRVNHLHHPRLIVIESNGYQTALVESLRTDPETKLLPIKGFSTAGDKQARLRGLAPLFEAGSIRLPKEGLIIEEELLHFPNGADDTMDSLWLAIQGVQMQRTEPRVLFTDDLDQVVA